MPPCQKYTPPDSFFQRVCRLDSLKSQITNLQFSKNHTQIFFFIQKHSRPKFISKNGARGEKVAKICDFNVLCFYSYPQLFAKYLGVSHRGHVTVITLDCQLEPTEQNNDGSSKNTWLVKDSSEIFQKRDFNVLLAVLRSAFIIEYSVSLEVYVFKKKVCKFPYLLSIKKIVNESLLNKIQCREKCEKN